MGWVGCFISALEQREAILAVERAQTVLAWLQNPSTLQIFVLCDYGFNAFDPGGISLCRLT